jgi:hypothetical protein
VNDVKIGLVGGNAKDCVVVVVHEVAGLRTGGEGGGDFARSVTLRRQSDRLSAKTSSVWACAGNTSRPMWSAGAEMFSVSDWSA